MKTKSNFMNECKKGKDTEPLYVMNTNKGSAMISNLKFKFDYLIHLKKALFAQNFILN